MSLSIEIWNDEDEVSFLVEFCVVKEGLSEADTCYTSIFLGRKQIVNYVAFDCEEWGYITVSIFERIIKSKLRPR